MSFQGIYVFNGNNAATFSDNPAIAGTYLGFYWAQIETAKGVYNWDIIDAAMKPWVDAGKHVILRISVAGQRKWQPPNSGHGTPQWVYDGGVKSVTETDSSVLPQYWNPLFVQHLSDFIAAFAARYDGNANITAIEIGVGVGGETKADTMNNGKARMKQWKAIGYTDKVWLATIQKIVDAYKAAFKTTPLAIMPDASFIGGSKGFNEQLVIDLAIKANLWIQDNGLIAKEPRPGSWKNVPSGYPIISEQRNPTSVSHDSLLQDLQTALDSDFEARIILVFAQDITAANQATLAQVAALAKQS